MAKRSKAERIVDRAGDTAREIVRQLLVDTRTIVPRLIAAGADLNRIASVDGTVDDRGLSNPFDPSVHMESLRQQVRQVPGEGAGKSGRHNPSYSSSAKEAMNIQSIKNKGEFVGSWDWTLAHHAPSIAANILTD